MSLGMTKEKKSNDPRYGTVEQQLAIELLNFAQEILVGEIDEIAKSRIVLMRQLMKDMRGYEELGERIELEETMIDKIIEDSQYIHEYPDEPTPINLEDELNDKIVYFEDIDELEVN